MQMHIFASQNRVWMIHSCLGFAMALAMNAEAMQKFAMLGEDQRQRIIEGTHSVRSREEMQQYVNGLVSNDQTDTKV